MTFLYDEISCTADTDSVLNHCRMALRCPLGSFYPNKDFGNSLTEYSELGELLSAARLAVCHIDGVFIKSVEQLWDAVELIIMINEEERRLLVALEKNI